MTASLILHTILALLLLIIPFGALYVLDRPTIRPLTIALIKGIVQLLVFSLIIWAVYKIDNTWVNILWFLAMSIWGGFMVVKKCKLQIKDYMLPASAGLFGGTILVGLWLLITVLPIDTITARWFVPVMAVLLGHSAAMMVRGLSSFATMFQRNRAQYDFLLGNGASQWQALAPFIRTSLLAVISPTIANHRQPLRFGISSNSPAVMWYVTWRIFTNQRLCRNVVYAFGLYRFISIIIRHSISFSKKTI